MIGVVDLDEFDGSLSVYCVEVISCVRMSWFVIFKVYVSCYVCWEIVLLFSEDLYKFFSKCSVLDGRHGGNNSVVSRVRRKA